MLRLEIREPGQKIDAAIARREAGEPQAPYWLGLSGDERGAARAGLRAWAGQAGLVRYRGYFAKLPPCCPSPGGRNRALHREGGVAPDLR